MIRNLGKIFFLFFILLFLGCSFMISRVIPLNDIKSPTGSYNIGTQIFYWTDLDREEWFSEETDDSREIVVQVWYPSINKGKVKDPWLDHPKEREEALIENFKVPKFIAQSIDRVGTDTYININPDTDKIFPVIIFSHGFEGFRSQNTTQIQELVSHGYIVFALDHTYDAVLTILEDGTQVPTAKKYCKGCDTEKFYDVFLPQIDTRIADIMFLIDQIEKIKSSEIKSNLSNIINFEQIGVFGHSFGGGTSLAVSILDPRVKSCLSLDGWYSPVHPDVYNQGLSKPFLHLGQTEWDEKVNYKILDNILKTKVDIGYKVSLIGSHHYDFTDSPHLSNLSSIFKLSSDLDSEEILEVTNTTVLGFFDTYLKSKTSDWLDKIESNKNILIEKFNNAEK